MKVVSAEFLKSALQPEQYPNDRKPEIAFIGRSNVGKSSLLNTLLARQGLAKTSGTPGKTQTLNFFTINGSFYFVDLPGYGFAKVPKALKDQWNIVMREYLEAREPLRMAVLLLDSRHLPNQNDLHMLELLEEAAVPTVLVAGQEPGCDAQDPGAR
jgi:GTP-binding protein